jgi:GNAT superfamily N-acetyltransferase
MKIRGAQQADTPAIARLHTNSWRSAYRGILRDDYLDGALAANRQELWRTRLELSPSASQVVVVAEEAGEVRAFFCAFLNADPTWGTLLDNLHVDPALKGNGLGRQLMGVLADEVLLLAASPALHLWAYEQNHGARRFYERLGGMESTRETEEAPDGTMICAVRYCSTDAATLTMKGIQ